MVLSKLKHFFYNFIFNNHVFAVYLRHSVNVCDDVTTTKAIRRVNDKMFTFFWYFYVSKWLITKECAKKNLFHYCNWRLYDIKTRISYKINGISKFNYQQREFYLNKTIIFGVFLSQRSPWKCLVQNTNRKYRRSGCTCIFCQNCFRRSTVICTSDSDIFRCHQTNKKSISKLSNRMVDFSIFM